MNKIKSYLCPNINFYAHHKERDKETLEEHSELTYEYYKRIVNRKALEKMIYAYLKEQDLATSELVSTIVNLFENAIYLHDIGKINRNFQITKMGNDSLGNNPTENTKHSIFSTLLYLDICNDFIESKALIRNENKVIEKVCVNFAYIISRHHGYLTSLSSFDDIIDDALIEIKVNPDLVYGYKFYKRLNERADELINLVRKGKRKVKNGSLNDVGMKLFVLCKYLYAMIVTCDFYATSHYMSNKEIKSFGEIANVDQFTQKFYEHPLINKINNYSKFDDISMINHLRSQMYHEASDVYKNNIDKFVFYLEAPTGSGKTLTSLRLAVDAIESAENIKKIFYVFPFNTLIEQTNQVLEELFDSKDIAVVNSIEAIKKNEGDDYNTAYLDRIMSHYPIMLTSHVNFFKSIIGVSREAHLSFSHLSNSVVIIDEIQSYKNLIWQELILLIHEIAEIFNIKFIIMSATLPFLSELTHHKGIMLIKEAKKYFQNPIFKNRTKANYSLLDEGKISLNRMIDVVYSLIKNEEERILVEFIDKMSAREFYNGLLYQAKDSDYDIVELTGDDNILFRNLLIQRLKDRSVDGEFTYRKVVVVATQVIEAGIDIDMNMGFKDISLIDSEEQFAGRINRSCLKSEAPIFFFDCFETKEIYRNDIRVNFSLKEMEFRDIFDSKNYSLYFQKVLKRLNDEKNRFTENNIEIFYDNIQEMDYLKIHKRLKLIDDDNVTLFIPQSFEIDNVLVHGFDVWNEYVSLLNNRSISFTEKQIKLSELNKVFSIFTYTVRTKPLKYGDQLGEYLYLLDDDFYIEDGKFNRKLYNEHAKGSLSVEELIL